MSSPLSDPLDSSWARFTFVRLDSQQSWHDSARPSGHIEKYGSDTEYSRIQKFERPHDLAAFQEAIRWVSLSAGSRVLALGCNRGDELGMVWTHASDASHPIDLLGIDHCPSALMHARSIYPTPPFDFIQADLNDLTVLEQSHFDLVLALNTLHSPHLDGRALLRRVVKKHSPRRWTDPRIP